MKKFTLEAKVGVFVLVCLAIFVYAWFAVVGVNFEKGFELKAHFDSVEGLTKGVQVQIAGIKVGTVKDIRFDKDTGKALVTMEIKKEYENAIPADSRVLLRAKLTGLLGKRLRKSRMWSVIKSTDSTRKWPLPIAGSSTLISKIFSTRSLCSAKVLEAAKSRLSVPLGSSEGLLSTLDRCR